MKTFGTEVQIALPTIHLAIGERTLVGRYFFPREEERELVADTSFRTVLPVGEVDCPAFTQLGLSAFTEGEESFVGVMRATYQMGLGAPRDCPRACAWGLRFRADRIGDIMQETTRSRP